MEGQQRQLLDEGIALRKCRVADYWLEDSVICGHFSGMSYNLTRNAWETRRSSLLNYSTTLFHHKQSSKLIWWCLEALCELSDTLILKARRHIRKKLGRRYKGGAIVENCISSALGRCGCSREEPATFAMVVKMHLNAELSCWAFEKLNIIELKKKLFGELQRTAGAKNWETVSPPSSIYSVCGMRKTGERRRKR